MAVKYVDHGAYGNSAFTASISGTTMTVSAVASGQIGIGTEVAGGTTSAGTYVTGFGTGTGVRAPTPSTTLRPSPARA